MSIKEKQSDTDVVSHTNVADGVVMGPNAADLPAACTFRIMTCHDWDFRHPGRACYIYTKPFHTLMVCYDFV